MKNLPRRALVPTLRIISSRDAVNISSSLKFSNPKSSYLNFNPQAPVAQKIADEMVFRHFQGEGVELFLKSDLTDPPSDF